MSAFNFISLFHYIYFSLFENFGSLRLSPFQPIQTHKLCSKFFTVYLFPSPTLFRKPLNPVSQHLTTDLPPQPLAISITRSVSKSRHCLCHPPYSLKLLLIWLLFFSNFILFLSFPFYPIPHYINPFVSHLLLSCSSAGLFSSADKSKH